MHQFFHTKLAKLTQYKQVTAVLRMLVLVHVHGDTTIILINPLTGDNCLSLSWLQWLLNMLHGL